MSKWGRGGVLGYGHIRDTMLMLNLLKYLCIGQDYDKQKEFDDP